MLRLLELMRIWTEDRNTVLASERGPEESTHDGLRDVLAGFFSYQEAPPPEIGEDEIPF